MRSVSRGWHPGRGRVRMMGSAPRALRPPRARAWRAPGAQLLLPAPRGAFPGGARPRQAPAQLGCGRPRPLFPRHPQPVAAAAFPPTGGPQLCDFDPFRGNTGHDDKRGKYKHKEVKTASQVDEAALGRPLPRLRRRATGFSERAWRVLLPVQRVATEPSCCVCFWGLS